MKRTLLALATALTMTSAFSASASVLDEPPAQEPSNWEISVNYLDIRSEVDGADIEINTGVLAAGFGYEFMQEGGHLSYTPELVLGKGVQNDTIGGAEVEVDSLVSAALRVTLHPTEQFEVFVRPSYSKLSVTVSEFGQADRETGDWEFGIGAGVGLNVNENVNVAITFDRVAGDSDVLGASIRYRF
tara:strand:+ start:200 stop:760 length:561 start_codon:yes stop_codon:yes gene_type:complete